MRKPAYREFRATSDISVGTVSVWGRQNEDDSITPLEIKDGSDSGAVCELCVALHPRATLFRPTAQPLHGD